MTVKELMELLEKYPDDLRVVVNGYGDISPEKYSYTQLTRFVARGLWVLLATVYYIKRLLIPLIWY